MVNFLRMELKKVLGVTRYSEDATYIGSCGYVKDYQILADEISQYVGLFQEAEITQGPLMNM